MQTPMRASSLALAAAGGLTLALLWLQHARAANSAVLVFAAIAGLLAAAALARGNAGRVLRHERDLMDALGQPLLAARPSTPGALRALAGQLREHWFVGQRLLPIVDLGDGEAGAALACELARALAESGEPVLLIDADLRSPGLHERFAVAQGRGLADALDGLDSRDFRLVRCAENLALLPAGTGRAHPLELLGRPRLARVLGAAAGPFGAVLVRTSPVSRGPDFEIFAALAGGALVLAAHGAGARQLAAVRGRLARCSARLVATVVER
ncbi:MAG TPA: hypothetical protein VFV74_10480 [Burkholderiales bacterium]|nr:hypothetical protein [Burkholderiales bacterium]